MKQLSYTYWQDGEYYLGFLKDYPDYETQGKSLEELRENLKTLFEDIEKAGIPYIRHTAELTVN